MQRPFPFQEFTVSMFLRQEWHDFRLAHEQHGTLPLRGTDLDKIWRPDTYFTNNNDYKLYEDNQLALISKVGKVYYSARCVKRKAIMPRGKGQSH